MPLTEKKKRFGQEYIVDVNATQAAIRAGYSEKTANEQGARLLADVSVQAYITELMAERSKRLEITADMVLKDLWSIAQQDIKDFIEVVPDDSGEGFKVRPKSNWRDIDTRNIAEVSVGKDGQFKFKLYCRDNALVNVGRHLGMFNISPDKPSGETAETKRVTMRLPDGTILEL